MPQFIFEEGFAIDEKDGANLLEFLLRRPGQNDGPGPGVFIKRPCCIIKLHIAGADLGRIEQGLSGDHFLIRIAVGRIKRPDQIELLIHQSLEPAVEHLRQTRVFHHGVKEAINLGIPVDAHVVKNRIVDVTARTEAAPGEVQIPGQHHPAAGALSIPIKVIIFPALIGMIHDVGGRQIINQLRNVEVVAEIVRSLVTRTAEVQRLDQLFQV